MKKALTLVLALMVLASLSAVAGDAASSGNAPKLVRVTTVHLKPGSLETFGNVVKQVRAAVGDDAPAHWIAMTASTGNRNEIGFVGLADSYAELERAEKVMNAAFRSAQMKNASYMEQVSESEKAVHQSIARLREDLSYHLDQFDLANGTRQEVTVVRFRPGTEQAFEELEKEAIELHKRADINEHWATYQVESGAPATTYYIVRTLRSLADLDKDADLREAHKAAIPKSLRERFSDVARESISYAETRVWDVSPEFSRPTEALLAANPDFWRRGEKEAEVAGKDKSKAKSSGVQPAVMKEKEKDKKPQ